MWDRSEGRIGTDHIVLRDAHQVRVLRLSDGKTVWTKESPTPVVTLDMVANLIVVAADSLTAYGLTTSSPVWQVPQLRGARVAITPDGRSVVAFNEQGLRVLDVSGKTLWQIQPPTEVREAMPDRLSVDQHTAYLTFRPRGEPDERLAVDVMAIALD